MDEETRGYFEEMRCEFGGLRGEFGELRAEVRSQIDELRGEMGEMRLEFDARFESVDRKFDLFSIEIRKNGVVAEYLRGEVKLLIEKVDLNSAALDRLRADVYRDMNAGFATMHAAFAGVRLDIDDLRARL